MGRERAFERGQVIPLWLIGTVCALALGFLAMNYANVVRYQIRAQNAADATAATMIAVQADEFNEMNTLLYAANVEEYRIRRILDAMLLSVNGDGGCAHLSTTATTEGSCTRAYADLIGPYTQAVQRYSADILYLNAVSAENNPANVSSGIQYAYLANTYHCTPTNISQSDFNALYPTATSNSRTEQGGDCAVTYSINATSARTGLSGVDKDATNVMIPALGHTCSACTTDSESANQFQPLTVDLVTCVRVPPLIPNFGPIHWPSYVAVGRAAATAAIIEQDWLQPGKVCDPYHFLGGPGCGAGGTTAFQPTEDYTKIVTDSSVTDPSDGSAYDWYDVNYGGNDDAANTGSLTFSAPLVRDEMSAHLGWWGAVPIAPFGPAPSVSC